MVNVAPSSICLSQDSVSVENSSLICCTQAHIQTFKKGGVDFRYFSQASAFLKKMQIFRPKFISSETDFEFQK